MQETVKKVLTGDFNRKKALLFLLTALVTVFVWNLPIDSFGIEGLTVVQQRIIAIFVMAVMLWLTEAIPAWATSVVIIFVLLFFASDSAFKIMQGSEAEMGQLLDYQGVMACFADPTIILFLGGFVLAIAATKSGLDAKMARLLIAPFGKRSENVLLGFMLITGIFSMFISNTATAAMMLTFLTPVFKALPPGGKGRVALTMAIPIGANLGGMGTPIGTPPNAFAYKVLNDPQGLNMGIGFGDWMLIMAPMVILMLIVAWFILLNLTLTGALLLPGAACNNLSFYLPVSPGLLLASTAGVCGVVEGVLHVLGRSGPACFGAELSVAGQVVPLSVFCDTGFHVQEPLSGRAVVLVRLDAVPLPAELRAYLDACLAGVGAEPRPEWGVRFVPCQTVAGHCLLPALPAALASNGRKQDGIYAAFCDMPPPPGGWTALVSAETAALLGK